MSCELRVTRVTTAIRRVVRFTASVLLFLAVQAPMQTMGQATDCTGYDSQIWAQSVFETDPTRYAALDLDGNRLACEDLQPGAAPAWWTIQIPAGAEPAQLASVTDGDTIRVLLNGQNEPVRLILIDTPETHDPNRPPECYGQEATQYLSWLLSLGGTLYVESDVSDRDRFNRLLRYAWLDFGDGEVYLVNEVMARSGYAAESTFPPDLKYEEQVREAARFAREHEYGLWSGCVTDSKGDTNELADTPVEQVIDNHDGTYSLVRAGVVVETWYGTDGLQAAPPSPARGTTTIDKSGHIVPAQGVPINPLAPITSAPAPEQIIIADPVEAFDCDPSYPDVCIPTPPPDLDCGDIGARRFTVYPPDPHGFDGDFDGIGCESG